MYVHVIGVSMSSGSKVNLRAMLARGLRGLWHLVPEGLRHRTWQLAGPKFQTAHALRQLARPSKQLPEVSSVPLVVAGLFSTANGIGEAARSTYRSLQAAGLNPVAVDLSEHLAPVDMDSGIACQPMPADGTGILILQLNGPETIAAIQHLGLQRGRNWFTIGYWAWELPDFPAGWERAFPYLSQIWTISTFAGEALSKHPAAPDIHVVPHAIVTPHGLEAARCQFDLPENPVIFLTMADAMSSLERKNPFAAIAAFQQAFGNDPDRLLIVKTRNLARDERANADMLAAIEGAPNIRLLDASLSDDERWQLMMVADVVVSLHRSEGFGLVLAEAMSLGKPTIATAWSGNMDFSGSDTACLVDYELVETVDSYGVYSQHVSQWAECDLTLASEYMKQLAESEGLRQQIGAAARTRLTACASASRIGAMMADLLKPEQADDRSSGV